MLGTKNRMFAPILLCLAGLAVQSTAQASLLSWNNAGGGAASLAANWNPAQIPGNTDDLIFNLNNVYTVTYNATVNLADTHTYRQGTVTLNVSSPHSVTSGIVIGDLSGDLATMTLTTGTLTSNGAVVIGDANGSLGTLNVNDDDADFIVANGADLTLGNNGDAVLNITGVGRVEVADQFIAGSNASSSSTLNVSGFLAAFPFGRSTLKVVGTSQSRLGQGGDATVTISNGALASFDGDVVVSNGSASQSTVIVEDQGLLPATLDVAGNLLLGQNTSATPAGDATLTVNNGGSVDVGGALLVGGDLQGGVGLLEINTLGGVSADSVTCGVNGEIAMGGGSLGSTLPIVNESDGLISGFGFINADIDNQGAIQPTSGVGLTINGTLFNTTSNLIDGVKIHFGAGGGYEGLGTCQAEITGDVASTITATGTLSIGDTTTAGFSYNGTLDVGGSIVTLLDSNGAVLGGLTTIDSGRIECPAGIGVQNGAELRGDGLFVGDLTMSGKLNPDSPGNLGGLMTVQGDLLMNPTGIVACTLGGNPGGGNNDTVVVSGTATFDGTVQLSFKNGHIPHTGEQYILVNAVGGRIGTFDSIVVTPTPCNGVTFQLVYSSTAAIALAQPPDADVNRDDHVTVDDLLGVINAWGEGGGAANPANVNGADPVDVDDLLIVINRWGACP